MISYKMSRREKALLVALAVVLIAIAWFVLVYQATTNEAIRIEGEISETEAQINVQQARAVQMGTMKAVVEQRKAEGARAVEVPEFDNTKPLMEELNAIMAKATTYSLSFDDLGSGSSGFVTRGVRADYTTDSYDSAESIVDALANGAYPCRIDSVNIEDGSSKSKTSSGSGAVKASVHVTFFEKKSNN